MAKSHTSDKAEDPFHLSRFLVAQDSIYHEALQEITTGRKLNHWMWFIFPQIQGLGWSDNARLFAISSLDEAKAYLKHQVLGNRLLECSEALVALEGRSATDVFGFPDDLKLHSSATLFACITPVDSVFDRLLKKYFGGGRDIKTMQLLKKKD